MQTQILFDHVKFDFESTIHSIPNATVLEAKGQNAYNGKI